MVYQRTFLVVVGFGCLLALAGCGEAAITATSPFYADADVINDGTLEGRWILYGDNQPLGYDDNEAWDPPIKLIFKKPFSFDSQSPPEQKYYDLDVQTLNAGNKMKATLFQVAGEQFLDLESNDDTDEHVLLSNLLRTHLVLRVKRDGDVLVLGYLGKSWTEDQVPADRRNWKESWEGDDNPVLLLPTDDLKTLLAKSLTSRKAFPGTFRFSRKDSETSARDLVDYGERLMGNRFMERGDYASALKAYQEALNARPDNQDNYALLAFMQAANGDGRAARNPISIYIEKCRQVLERGFGSGKCSLVGDETIEKERGDLNTAEHDLLGLSYFAEGDWAGANREFNAALGHIAASVGPGDDQDTLLLLQSLTLMQLGRKADAAALLHPKEEPMDDTGRVLEEYLLGQIKDEDLLERLKAKQKSWHPHECNAECRANFFIASRHLAEGDRQLAQQWFQKTLALKEFIGVEPVIARLRLKQLDIGLRGSAPVAHPDSGIDSRAVAVPTEGGKQSGLIQLHSSCSAYQGRLVNNVHKNSIISSTCLDTGIPFAWVWFSPRTPTTTVRWL
jgi:tetratricopeptide (TPR) repeat protein